MSTRGFFDPSVKLLPQRGRHSSIRVGPFPGQLLSNSPLSVPPIVFLLILPESEVIPFPVVRLITSNFYLIRHNPRFAAFGMNALVGSVIFSFLDQSNFPIPQVVFPLLLSNALPVLFPIAPHVFGLALFRPCFVFSFAHMRAAKSIYAFTATHPAKLRCLQKQSTERKPSSCRRSSFQRAVTGTSTPSRDSRLRSISASE